MRNYLNKEEQYKHLELVLCQVQAESLIESDGLNDEQKELLKTVVKSIKRFNDLTFESLGDSYRKTIWNKSKYNYIDVRPKTMHATTFSKLDNYLDEKELEEIIDSNSDIDCCGCEKTNCKVCPIYRIKTYLGHEGKREDNDLCPYRKESEEFNIDGFGVEDL